MDNSRSANRPGHNRHRRGNRPRHRGPHQNRDAEFAPRRGGDEGLMGEPLVGGPEGEYHGEGEGFYPGGGFDRQAQVSGPPVALESKEGLLEIIKEGSGFLRFSSNNYLPSHDDIYVSQSLIRRYQIRPGSMVVGEVAPPRRQGQKPALQTVLKINDRDPDLHARETPFKDLTPTDPDQRFRLEVGKRSDISMRIVDLLTPIGRGQRALIVAPPRTGKTILMQKIANAIYGNCGDSVKTIILLVDERPEEVTDFRRNTKAEVIASCLDEGTANHVRVTEFVLEKMKRLVEAGQHVVVLLDSITRLGRAYNNETKHSGRILSGGIDAKTLAKPKAFFGAARNIENGGSITIIATALIDTGSRMDQVIFEEFKGTGNMELVLSRELANTRIFPAIDIAASGTRKEEKLFAPKEIEKIRMLRRVLNEIPKPAEAMRLLIDRMEKTEDNAEFLSRLAVTAHGD